MGNASNLLVKVAFIVSIIIHVLLWPTISHIVFASALALEGLVAYALTAREDVWATVFSPSLFFFHSDKSQRSYFPLVLIFFYMLYTFLWFANDEISIQPHMTTWIDNSLVNNYSFTQSGNNKFNGIDVTSQVSKDMRENSFDWPRTISAPAIRLVGFLQQAYANKANLNCQPAPTLLASTVGNASAVVSPFACYASRLFYSQPPSNVDVRHSVVPAPSQFYTVNVSITPPQGMPCSSLEAYRIVLDQDRNVENGLDYPASSVVRDQNNNNALSQFCNLFGIAGWCLHFQHTFTNAEYTARVAAKCAENQGVLTFQLPPRAIDIEPTTGKVGLDALIVTQGAHVHLDFEWQNSAADATSSAFVSTFQKPWVNPNGDAVTAWRSSSNTGAVFFKFFFLIIPLLFAWYFLGINFLEVVIDSQIMLLCIFVLFPSVLIFLSMGAWLPMAGSIVCVIAINHTPETSSMLSWWRSMIRPTLFFITAACNSVQFAWLLTLVGQAGYNAFLYEGSLKQLAELSSKFIISDSTSPTWIGLMMPSLLLVNLAFLLGSAVCIVLEALPRLATYRSQA
jgi:hypothetical protein